MTPVMIDNLCCMLVNTERDDIYCRPQIWQEDLRWYGQMVKDFTGS